MKLAGLAGGATYFGDAPEPRCVLRASRGTARCVVDRQTTTATSGTRVTFTAHAIGSAGATAETSVTVTTAALRLRGLRQRHGVFIVKLGATYRFEVASRSEPLYVDASVAPQRPQGTHAWFKRNGTLHGLPLWELPVYLPAGLADFKLWRIGIEIDRRLHVITIQT